MRLVGHIRSNSRSQYKSPRSIVRNFPKVITLPTEYPLSGSEVVFLGSKPVQLAFAFPAPGAPASGVLITCVADATMRQSTPAKGTLSPGLTLVRGVLAKSSA